MGPVTGDAVAMSAKQRLRCDDPAVAESAGERGRDRSEQGPVVIGQFGPIDLSSQHLKLVAEHDDLQLLGASRADCELSEYRYEAVENGKH